VVEKQAGNCSKARFSPERLSEIELKEEIALTGEIALATIGPLPQWLLCGYVQRPLALSPGPAAKHEPGQGVEFALVILEDRALICDNGELKIRRFLKLNVGLPALLFRCEKLEQQVRLAGTSVTSHHARLPFRPRQGVGCSVGRAMFSMTPIREESEARDDPHVQPGEFGVQY